MQQKQQVEKLNSGIPTTYTWFENTALPDTSLSAENQPNIDWKLQQSKVPLT